MVFIQCFFGYSFGPQRLNNRITENWQFQFRFNFKEKDFFNPLVPFLFACSKVINIHCSVET